MLAMKPETKLILKSTVIIQAIPELDHYYAFDTNSGDQFQLNHTAYWVLEKLIQKMTFQELLGRFAECFGLDTNTATDDLTEVFQFAFENRIMEEVTE